jgi:hypothetical protein
MATRSLTIVKESLSLSTNELVVIYKQTDGYPEGMGMKLANFLEGYKIINGIPPNPDPKSANGIHDLAAQLVAELTNGIGEIYLYPSGTRDVWEEFIYYIYPSTNNTLRIRTVETYHKTDPKTSEQVIVEKVIFDGTLSEMKEWLVE